MMDTVFEVAVLCPWCGLGKTLADKLADIRISCHCTICRRFYNIDFLTMRAIKAKATRPSRAKH